MTPIDLPFRVRASQFYESNIIYLLSSYVLQLSKLAYRCPYLNQAIMFRLGIVPSDYTHDEQLKLP